MFINAQPQITATIIDKKNTIMPVQLESGENEKARPAIPVKPCRSNTSTCFMVLGDFGVSSIPDSCSPSTQAKSALEWGTSLPRQRHTNALFLVAGQVHDDAPRIVGAHGLRVVVLEVGLVLVKGENPITAGRQAWTLKRGRAAGAQPGAL